MAHVLSDVVSSSTDAGNRNRKDISSHAFTQCSLQAVNPSKLFSHLSVMYVGIEIEKTSHHMLLLNVHYKLLIQVNYSHICQSCMSFGVSDIDRLQRIQNRAARIVLNARKYDHVSSLLKQLHWLPSIIIDIIRYCHYF